MHEPLSSDQGLIFMQVVLLLEAEMCVNVKRVDLCLFVLSSLNRCESSSHADGLDASSGRAATAPPPPSPPLSPHLRC